MFSEIDKSIFPDSCEILEIVPLQLFVYPIFKNGSSSLSKSAAAAGWKTLNQHDISNIQTPITVFLRDPRERFISGVNTFLQLCQREHGELDPKTILFFVGKYLFLNRHYAPQFFWLINLARYSQAPLKFQHVDDIKNLTAVYHRTDITPATQEFLSAIEEFSWEKLELYFLLDQLLIDRIGQQMTFVELINTIKKTHNDLYKLIVDHTHQITNVLSQT